MLRFINACLLLGLGALAYVIYQVKYEARALDEQIASLNKQLDGERDAIAVLRAEWSLLNRPERIEKLATKYLKLGPASPQQLVTLDTVSEADFERARTEAAHGTSDITSALPAPAPKARGKAGKPAKPPAD